jgi:hypothetical protein
MPQPTPYPQVPSLPGDSRLPASGAMSSSATPIPPQVLTLPDVSWSGGFTGLGNPAQWGNKPNAVDWSGKEIYVDPKSAAEYGTTPAAKAWQPLGNGLYAPVGDVDLWFSAEPAARAGAMLTSQMGGNPTIGAAAFAENVNTMPSMEDYTAMDTFYKQFIPDWQTVDPRQWQAGVLEAIGGRNEAMLGIMRGGSAVDPWTQKQNARTEVEWAQQDADRVAKAAYDQQYLALQAQQAAANAAAQRRQQAMSLAESILGAQQQQWAQVSGWALPPGSQTAPGWEQGGAVSQMFAKQGLPYTPIQAVQTPGVDYAPAYAWAQKLLGGS